MAVSVTKLLAFAFWELRRFFRASPYDDGYSEWKALAVICVAQVALVLSAIGFISVSVGHSVLFSSRKWVILFGCFLSVGVTAVNYYALRFQNKWSKYQAEFESYSTFTQTVGGVAVAVALILVLVATSVSKNGFNHLVK